MQTPCQVDPVALRRDEKTLNDNDSDEDCVTSCSEYLIKQNDDGQEKNT